MGLFSGSFGTGLVTGLATSVDKSLRNAMDKRDEEMSAARKFWQTRQAQKMDLAEERDRRTNDALDRMIDEMDGDIAAGVAAFKAAGGDVDQVEAFIKSMDETRNAGMKYNLVENLDLKGVDLSQYEDLTLDAARKGFATEVAALDVQMEDMSGLAKIGLGMKDMGKGISSSVNKLIPPREREAIKGLTGGVLDRSKLITSVRARNELANSLPDLERQIGNNLYMIANGTNLFGETVPAEEITSMKEKNAQLISTYAAFKSAEKGATGPTLSQISTGYSAGYRKLKEKHKWNLTNEGVFTIENDDGEIIEGPDAKNYWTEKESAWEKGWVADNILDESGDFRGSEADDASRLLGLDNVTSAVRSSFTVDDGGQAADAAAAASSTQPSAEEIAKRLTTKYTTPSSFADAFKGKAKDAESLYNMMVQYYGDVDDATLSQIAMDAIASKPPPRDFVPSGTTPKQNAPVALTSLTPGSNAYNEWISTYGDTHNPDGTPK
jgi:hypothetical protein